MAQQVPSVINRNDNEPAKDRISITLDHIQHSYLLNSELGQKLYEAIKAKAGVEDVRLIVTSEAWNVAKNFQIEGKDFVLDDRDQLRLNGRVVDFGLTPIIKRMAEAGEDIEPLVNFMERVDKNPNKSVAKDLYRFLAKGGLPITPDGCFHANKRVGADFKSIHSGNEPTWTEVAGLTEQNTGKTHYPIGSVVWMRREDCDEDRSRTCSRGLHACSFDYLQSFSGERIINVRIDPQDVTAIPNDYNDAKLRCCRMTVLAEIPEDDAKKYFSHVVDRRHPAVVQPAVPAPEVEPQEPEGPTDWGTSGREAGVAMGRSDKENEYQYDPAVDFPYELDADDHAETPEEEAEISAHRQAFARGFHEGYAQGWNEADAADGASAEEREDEPEIEEVSVEDAKRMGAEDGEQEAQADHDNGHGYINDFTDGEHRYEADDAGHDEAYQVAFNAAYVAKWQALNP